MVSGSAAKHHNNAIRTMSERPFLYLTVINSSTEPNRFSLDPSSTALGHARREVVFVHNHHRIGAIIAIEWNVMRIIALIFQGLDIRLERSISNSPEMALKSKLRSRRLFSCPIAVGISAQKQQI
jgi:hypothetical protein